MLYSRFQSFNWCIYDIPKIIQFIFIASVFLPISKVYFKLQKKTDFFPCMLSLQIISDPMLHSVKTGKNNKCKFLFGFKIHTYKSCASYYIFWNKYSNYYYSVVLYKFVNLDLKYNPKHI